MQKPATDTRNLLKNAVRKIEEMQAKIDALENQIDDPIAIVGMACRFPGADTPEAYWELLRDGRDLMREVPPDRWDMDAYYDPVPGTPGKSYVRESALLDQIDQFDPHFFGISPREAASMDPQHRLLLEVSWEALERAGQAPSRLQQSRTGVFIGMGRNDYGRFEFEPELVHTYVNTGNAFCFASGRLSYLLGLQGPNMTIDTACSASVVALHLACQSLHLGECDLALVGGVNAILSPMGHVSMSQMQSLAADGRCKTFDADADGYNSGEGCGMVVLKRLSDAVADGDNPLAIIRGSAVNHDGASSGLTVPNAQAQAALIQAALENSKVHPHDVMYVDAHGTGTAVGDPIEIRGLADAYDLYKRQSPLLVGSAKTNVGHLEAAAGITSVIKVILAMQHGEIPPHLHFHTPNPLLDWEKMAIQVPTTRTPWPAGIKRAGVSSFGMGGTNAHVILEEAPPAEPASTAQATAIVNEIVNEPERSLHLFTLSAKNEAALLALVQRYHAFLNERPDTNLADLCYTANVGRNHFDYRLSLVAGTIAEMREKLQTYGEGAAANGAANDIHHGYHPAYQASPNVAFLFSGHGAQYIDMGRELYATQPTFRRVIDRCDALFQELLSRSLIELLYPQRTLSPEDAHAPESNELMTVHHCGQAAIFAIECALADLWRSWGVLPDVVLGHSLGDFAAAYTAGVLTLEDGLRLVVERGRLMESAVGEMVSIRASVAEITPFLMDADDVTIAAINGPASVVISGGSASIALVVAQVQQAGFKTRPVAVPMAAHSPLLDPVLDTFEAAVRQVALAPPKLTVISSMTGQIVSTELTEPQYWRQQLRNTVHFADGIVTLQEQGIEILLEIGPTPTLLGMAQSIYVHEVAAKRHLGFTNGTQDAVDAAFVRPKSNPANPLLLPSLRRDRSDWSQILESLGALYVHGVKIDWQGFDQEYQRRKLVLPTYPFQRERYWVDVPQQRDQGRKLRPLVGTMMHLPRHNETVFETVFSVGNFAFLADHKVFDKVIAPGACQLAMVLSCAEIAVLGAGVCLEDVVLPQALIVPADGECTVQVSFTPDYADKHTAKTEFNVIGFDGQSSVPTTEPTTHALGFVTQLPIDAPTVDIAQLQQHCHAELTGELAGFYTQLQHHQIELGASFQWICGVWQAESETSTVAIDTVDTVNRGVTLPEILVQLALPEVIGRTTGYALHPGLLDACFQVVMLGEMGGNTPQATILPFALRKLTLFQPMHHAINHRNSSSQMWWCHARQIDSEKWDIQLLGETGTVIARIEGFQGRVATSESLRGTDAWRDWLYEVVWKPRPFFGMDVTWLPAPVTMQTKLVQQLPTILSSSALGDYREAQTSVERLCIAYIVTALAKSGLTLQPGTRWSTAQAAQETNTIPTYLSLLETYLELLSVAGILSQEDEQWVVRTAPPRIDIATALREAHSDYGQVIGAELALLARCGEHMQAVLQGAQDPVELFYPNGSTAIIAPIFTNSALYGVLDTIAQHLVENAIQKLPSTTGIRILEIGAGSGGTTARLLPQLPAAQTEYTFTDVSQHFLTEAQTRFADYPFMRYQRLDIEQSPREQGFPWQQFDIVIATFTVHVLRDLPQVFLHIRQLLKPGGLLLLAESIADRTFNALTFALSQRSWQIAADDPRHQGMPTMVEWQQLLTDNGFSSVHCLPDEALIAANGLHEAIFMAQASMATLPVPMPSPQSGHQWIIFADGAGVGRTVAAELRQQGGRVILVYAKSDYQQIDEHTFQIHPDHAQEYAMVLEHIQPTTPCGVVHLWSLDAALITQATDVESIVKQSCGTVLHLVQTLLQQQHEPLGLWLVTQHAQAVNAHETVAGVAQSPLWGMGRVIGLEHPELNCRRLDLGEGTIETQAADLCAELTAKITMTTMNEPEDLVALRNGKRYVARLTRSTTHVQQPIACDPEATYLITGGMGGMGLEIAEWFAQEGGKHLVLMGRSQPNPTIQMRITRLIEQGVDVRIAQADVTDRTQVAAVLHGIDRAHPLRGIIHAVGVLDDGAVLFQNWERFFRVLQPKMQGAWHLHQLTQESNHHSPLDFFILFSSARSWMGGRGQANHAAANAFLDAFAHYRRAQGLPAQSINWGAWTEVGAGVALADATAPERAEGGITTAQGIAAFAYLLKQDATQVGVLPVTWSRYLDEAGPWSPFYEEFAVKTHQIDAVPETRLSLHQQLAQAADETERAALLMQQLQAMVATTLGIADPTVVDPQQGLLDMGVDSLMAIELRNQLGKLFESKFPSTLIFDYPTLEKIQIFLTQHLAEVAASANWVADGPTNATDSQPETKPTDTTDGLTENVELLSAEELMAQIAQEYQQVQ